MLSRALLLNTGRNMPALGLGTYQSQRSELEVAVDCALQTGYKHIDTAVSYENEHIIGDVIQSRVKSGELKRKDLFLTTKVPQSYLAREDVRPCVQESLEKLKTKYVDLLLIHVPFGVKKRGDGEFKPFNAQGELELQEYDLTETWAAMKDVWDEGLTRSIGVSNFNVGQIERIIRSGPLPACVQSECHPYYQQRKLKSYCDDKGIVFTAYAPLGAMGRPEAHVVPGTPVLMEDPTIASLAKKYDKTVAQVLLRYLLQRDFAVVAKSVSPARIKENFDVYDFAINDEDMSVIQSLDRNCRYFIFKQFQKHPEFNLDEPF